jgi:hypothetical protein
LVNSHFGDIAGFRRHPNKGAIIIFNLFLGWTFIGWVVALVWGFTNPAQAPAQTVIYMAPTADGTIQAVTQLAPPPVPKTRLEDHARKIPWWGRLLILTGVIAMIAMLARGH